MLGLVLSVVTPPAGSVFTYTAGTLHSMLDGQVRVRRDDIPERARRERPSLLRHADHADVAFNCDLCPERLRYFLQAPENPLRDRA